MVNPLTNVYGSLLVVRPPVPVTVNKAGANYKSEVTHNEYSPRRAFEEWMAICEGIVANGGDALFEFEACDEPYLDHNALAVGADGTITPHGSRQRLGHLAEIMTGRVFTANGPWVIQRDGRLRAVLPNMLAHRQAELPYYRELLLHIAGECALAPEIIENPYRFEGMADVAVVGDRVVLTFAVPGHYDEGLPKKSERSSRDGVKFAADQLGVPEEARIYSELVYPHFHGDTVHFGARPPKREPLLVHYPGGLYRDHSNALVEALGSDRVRFIERQDAVEAYAGNSRQINDGVLIPDGASPAFQKMLEELGLSTHRVPLFELFGKAGGGPACATLYLPRNLTIAKNCPLRYSQRKAEVERRRERLPETVRVDPAYFEGKLRG